MGGQRKVIAFAAAEWGASVVENLVYDLARVLQGRRGFAVQNIWRLRQIHDTCAADARLSSPAIEMPWTHNLIILNQVTRTQGLWAVMPEQKIAASRKLSGAG